MSSGIVKLIAIGSQDEHIMGKPEISFFSSTFKRHSNFSQTVEKQMIQGAVNGGSMSTIRFEKTGDLLGYTYFTIDDNNASLDHPDCCLLYTSPSPRDRQKPRMPSSA